MMNQMRWGRLANAFKEDDKFNEEGYASEQDFKNLNLYEWLECKGAQPSYQMVKEFAETGFKVYPVELDSFGWLIGGVRMKNDPSGRTITFG